MTDPTGAPSSGGPDVEALLESVRSGSVTPDMILDMTIEMTRSEDPELAELIRACAVPRFFNAEVIGVLRERPGEAERNAALLDRLRGFNFVLTRRDGENVYHPATRDQLLDAWRSDPEGFEALNRRLAEHYRARLGAANALQRDFYALSPLIREANEDRFGLLARAVEARVTAPLLEALHHGFHVGGDYGIDLLGREFQRLEMLGETGLCGTVLHAARDAVERLPGDDRRRRLRQWLDYYEARQENQIGRHDASAAISERLLEEPDLEDKLKLWALSNLGLAHQQRFRLQDAREVLERELALAVETEADTYNIPSSYARTASVSRTLNDLDRAVEHSIASVRTARRFGNRLQELRARIDLAGTLQQDARPGDALEVDLETLDCARAEFPDDASVAAELSARFIESFKHAAPALCDLHLEQGVALLRLIDSRKRETGLRLAYLDALSDAGRIAAGDRALDAAMKLAMTVADDQLACDVALAEGLFRTRQGRPEEAAAAYGRLLAMADDLEGGAWLRAAALSNRGQELAKMARWDESERDFDAALGIWRSMGHAKLVAFVEAVRASTRQWHERHSAARAAAERAGDPAAKAAAEAAALRDEGAHDAAAARFDDAIAALRRAHPEKGPAEAAAAALLADRALMLGSAGRWAAAARDARAAAAALDASGGAIATDLGLGPAPESLDPARSVLERAAAALRHGAPIYRADTLRILGSVLLDQGRPGEATERIVESRGIEASLQRPSWDAQAAALLGKARAADGDATDAAAALREAAESWETLAALDAWRPGPEAEAAFRAAAEGLRNCVAAPDDREALVRARDLLREAAEHPAARFPANLELAYVAIRLGDRTEACEALAAALEARPPGTACAPVIKRLIRCRLDAAGALRRDAPDRARSLAVAARAALDALPQDTPVPWQPLDALRIDAGYEALRWGEFEAAESGFAQALDSPQAEADQRARALFGLACAAAAQGRDADVAARFAAAAEAAERDDIPADGDWISDPALLRRLLMRLRSAERARPLTENARARLSAWRTKLAGGLLDAAWRAAGAPPPSSVAMPLATTPIAVEMDLALLPPEPEPDDSRRIIATLLPRMRDRIRADTGVTVPEVRIRELQDGEPGGYRLLLRDAVFAVGSARPGLVFRADAETAERLGTPSEERTAFDPRTGRSDGFWVAEADSPDDGGSLAGDAYVIRHLEHVLRGALHVFVGPQELEAMLAAWRDAPDGDDARARREALATAALSAPDARPRLLRAFRLLMAERVPAADLGPLLNAIADGAEAGAAAEAARWPLRARLPGRDGDGPLHALSPEFEAEIAAGLRELPCSEGGGRALILPDERARALVRAAAAALGDAPPDAALMVRTPGLRPFVRAFLERDLPGLPVLAARELPDGAEARLTGDVRAPAESSDD